MQGNYRWSILSPSWELWKKKLILRQAGASAPLKWECKVPALTWCLPKALLWCHRGYGDKLGSEIWDSQEKFRGFILIWIISTFPLVTMANVPTLSRCLNRTNARKSLIFWLPYEVLIRECSENLNDIFCWVNTDDELAWCLALEGLEELELCFCSRVVSVLDWAVSLGSFSLSLCHTFKARVTLQ